MTSFHLFFIQWVEEHEGRTCDELEQYRYLMENDGNEKDVAAMFERTQLGQWNQYIIL